jgi:2-polyprenyl-3-methyl-5-hydroxy-6-metoxy-1,4-benzoquinol methylase
VHLGVRQFLEPQHTLHTLDLTDTYSPTFVGDICAKNHNIQNDFYDAVFMTEVIEHVLNPFIAIKEILRVLKPGGVLFTSSPFNFRIHGPLPDCWRITEHGWRILLSDFVDVVIEEEVSFDRFLMPIHYRVTARKPIQM